MRRNKLWHVLCAFRLAGFLAEILTADTDLDPLVGAIRLSTTAKNNLDIDFFFDIVYTSLFEQNRGAYTYPAETTDSSARMTQWSCLFSQSHRRFFSNTVNSWQFDQIFLSLEVEPQGKLSFDFDENSINGTCVEVRKTMSDRQAADRTVSAFNQSFLSCASQRASQRWVAHKVLSWIWISNFLEFSNFHRTLNFRTYSVPNSQNTAIQKCQFSEKCNILGKSRKNLVKIYQKYNKTLTKIAN